MGSPRGWILPGRSSASGASASSRREPPASRSAPAAGGRPAFPPSVVAAVKALACQLPRELGLPLSRLSNLRDTAGGGRTRARGVDRRNDPLAMVERGRHSTLVPPELAVPSRSGFRGEGWTSPRPVRGSLGWDPPGLLRLRTVHRREDEHPSAQARPPHASLSA